MRIQTTSLIISCILLFGLLAVGCSAPQQVSLPPVQPVSGTSPSPSAPAMPQAKEFTLHISGAVPGALLPIAYSCTGSSESPAISWENVPAGTKTLALIMDDPDASSGRFTHWIVYNIPPERKSIPGGQTALKEIAGGGQQGTSSGGDRGYYPACPPIGQQHRYVFTLYAVDYIMGLPTADRDGIDAMLNGHVVGKTTMTTTFRR